MNDRRKDILNHIYFDESNTEYSVNDLNRLVDVLIKKAISLKQNDVNIQLRKIKREFVSQKNLSSKVLKSIIKKIENAEHLLNFESSRSTILGKTQNLRQNTK